MTAAHRFRDWGWLFTTLVVALVCYMMSLQVAGERRKLEAAASSVRQARADIRRLETEFDARASMAQLQQWNDGSFGYAAPSAEQFVNGPAQLASLDPSQPAEGQPTMRLAALVVPRPVTGSAAPAVAASAAPPIEPAVAAVAPHRAPEARRHDLPSLGRVVVAAVAPVPARVLDRRPQVAMLDRRLLSDATLGSLKSLARQESQGR